MNEGTAPAGSVDEVLALFERWGPHRYDEEVTQLDHALQVAAHAAAAGASDALVAAALLHDTGHLLDLAAGRPDGAWRASDLAHEASGARWLAELLPPAVTEPIARHVTAKRYRCAVDPAYRATLSAGSTASLARQGGPLSGEEQVAFEALPGHRDAVRLRGWDDAGKVTEGVAVADLSSYRPLLLSLARSGAG